MDNYILNHKEIGLQKSVRVSEHFRNKSIINLVDYSFEIEHTSPAPLNIQFTFTDAHGHQSTYSTKDDIKKNVPFGFNMKDEDYGKLFSGVELEGNNDTTIVLTIKPLNVLSNN